MVFQNYAVWPHMTVFQNVAYPLKIRKFPKRKIKEKVEQTLELVGMEGYEERYPEQLSGGQQQRVALARALIMEPTAMLLDEPLSNLDAKLRERMRFEIMELHKKTKITIIYVTHDQAEAMVLSDRIIVMNIGYIQQIGTAAEIYREPANKFVADFIGIANFINCKLLERDGNRGKVLLGGEKRENTLDCIIPPSHAQEATAGQSGTIFIRPEDIEIRESYQDGIIGQVKRRTFLGNTIDYRINVNDMEWRIESNPEVSFEEGQEVSLQVKRAVFLRE
jgi:iron(III) transport system ATP-binding protein